MSAGRRAVAIGGGTGLPIVLNCLIALGYDTTAVVTMADDGGSSGALRRELGMLPPGDVRNCVVAMSDPASLLSRMFQYRFPHGEGLAGHALGNLIIAALADITGSFPDAIQAAEDLLGARGRVLPSTLADVVLHAEDREGRPVAGQSNIAESTHAVAHVSVEPAWPPAYGPALEAIETADVIVIGPGSLYTSIIPNFLVAGTASAVRESVARRVYICNVANHRGETCGLDAADHVQALVDHGLTHAIDVVIVNETEGVPLYELPAEEPAGVSFERVEGGADALGRIADLGPRVEVRPLVDPSVPLRHDRDRLYAALEDVL